MEYNGIRALIFLVAALVILLFPNKLYKFQVYVLDKLHIKHHLKKDDKANKITAIVFIIISIILFLLWVIYA